MRYLTSTLEVEIQIENGTNSQFREGFSPIYYIGPSFIQIVLDSNNQSRVVTVLTDDDNLFEQDAFVDVDCNT